MRLQTKFTEAVGIKHPIFMGGMHHVALGKLAGSVSKGGGLGCVTALSCGSPDALREQIRIAKDIAGPGKPVGVNLTLLPMLVPPNYQAYADVVVEENIPVIETAGHVNGLEPFVKLFKSKGRLIIHKCTQVRHAKTAQRMGADVRCVLSTTSLSWLVTRASQSANHARTPPPGLTLNLFQKVDLPRRLRSCGPSW